MTKPVKKENGDYFVSLEYHMSDIAKYEAEIKDLRTRIKKIEKENTELKEKTKELIQSIK